MVSTETVVSRMAPAGVRFAKAIEDACIEFGITTERQKAHFVGQLAHESGDFRQVIESLNYAAERLVPKFGAHRITEPQAMRYGRTPDRPADQEAIANLVYGGAWGKKNLGNTERGDGWRFRGRGLIQLTGRDNYRRCSIALFGTERLLREPELLSDPVTAARAAGWYWQNKGLGPWADMDDVLAVSRGVNLGNPRSPGRPKGIEDRAAKTAQAKRLFADLRGAA